MREFILGIIQGITEFLPISSSGHLVIGQHLLPGAVSAEEDVLLNILLHFATLLVVIIYYRHDIRAIFSDLFIQREHPTMSLPEDLPPQADRVRRKMLSLILVGTIPTGIVGVALKLSDRVDELFSSLPLVGLALVATGLLLWLSDRYQARDLKTDITYLDALIIGAIQGMAVLPGISRSGSTISASILRGIERKLAARFSFLLSVPAILGAVILEGKDILLLSQSPHLLPYAAGMLSAFVAGYAAIITMLRFVMRRQLRWFSFYCWTVGLIVLAYSFVAN